MNIKDALRDLMAAREERRLARIAYSKICSQICGEGEFPFELVVSDDRHRRYWAYVDSNGKGDIEHEEAFQEFNYLRALRAESNRKHGIAFNKFFRQANKLLKGDL